MPTWMRQGRHEGGNKQSRGYPECDKAVKHTGSKKNSWWLDSLWVLNCSIGEQEPKQRYLLPAQLEQLQSSTSGWLRRTLLSGERRKPSLPGGSLLSWHCRLAATIQGKCSSISFSISLSYLNAKDFLFLQCPCCSETHWFKYYCALHSALFRLA